VVLTRSRSHIDCLQHNCLCVNNILGAPFVPMCCEPGTARGPGLGGSAELRPRPSVDSVFSGGCLGSLLIYWQGIKVPVEDGGSASPGIEST
jgi:hypothetical protein